MQLDELQNDVVIGVSGEVFELRPENSALCVGLVLVQVVVVVLRITLSREYPSHVRPLLVHLRQLGFVWSHLIRRILLKVNYDPKT